MEISRQVCESAVRCALGGVEHIFKDYKVKPASDSAIGFMGIHLNIEATVLVDGKEEKLLMFAKTPPKSKTHLAFVVSRGHYSKEGAFYISYVQGLKSMLTRGLKLPFAECYYACGTGEVDNHLVILENLDLRGFKMMDKVEVLDLDHCKVVLDALARIHGSSALLLSEERNPEAHRRKKEFEKMEETLFPEDACQGVPGLLCRSAAQTLASTVSRLWPERFKDKTEEIFEHAWNAWQEVFRILPHRQNDPNVLCHGDPWSTNIMISYHKGENGKILPEEAMLVDLQQVRYSSPASDIVFFLYTTTSRNLRDAHFDDLILYYWEAFSGVVTPEFAAEFLPLDRLKKIVERMRVFGRIISTSLLSTVLTTGQDKEGNQEEESDFIQSMLQNRGEVVFRCMKRDSRVRERLAECYQEFLESVGLWR